MVSSRWEWVGQTFLLRGFRFSMSIPMSVPYPGMDSSCLSSKWSSELFSTQVLYGVAFEAFQPCTFLLFNSAKCIIFSSLFFFLFSEITNVKLLWIWQRHKRNFENLRELSHFTENNLSSQIEQQSLVVLQILLQQQKYLRFFPPS